MVRHSGVMPASTWSGRRARPAIDAFGARKRATRVAAGLRSRPYRDVPHLRPAPGREHPQEEGWDSPLPMSTWDPPLRRGFDTSATRCQAFAGIGTVAASRMLVPTVT